MEGRSQRVFLISPSKSHFLVVLLVMRMIRKKTVLSAMLSGIFKFVYGGFLATIFELTIHGLLTYLTMAFERQKRYINEKLFKSDP